MTFPIDLHVVDPKQGAIIFQVNNAFPPPLRPDGNPFSFPNISRLVWANNASDSNGWFCEEQDWYNPMAIFERGAKATTKAWRQAGGTFQSKEKLKMKHDGPAVASKSSKL